MADVSLLWHHLPRVRIRLHSQRRVVDSDEWVGMASITWWHTPDNFGRNKDVRNRCLYMAHFIDTEIWHFRSWYQRKNDSLLKKPKYQSSKKLSFSGIFWILKAHFGFWNSSRKAFWQRPPKWLPPSLGPEGAGHDVKGVLFKNVWFELKENKKCLKGHAD